MAGQTGRRITPSVPVAPAAAAPAVTTDTAAIDDLLAEIDAVLEENAEEFVKGFIQKGGQ